MARKPGPSPDPYQRYLRIRLMARRMTDAQIAAKLKEPLDELRGYARDNGISLTEDGAIGQPVVVPVLDRELEIFQREAAKRGVKTAILMSACLRVIATDDLFSAVLDAKVDTGAVYLAAR